MDLARKAQSQKKSPTYFENSERPEWNFTETGPKPKYGFFTEPEPTGTETQYRNNKLNKFQNFQRF